MLYVLSFSVFFPSRIFAKKIPIAFSENKRRRTKRKKTATFIISAFNGEKSRCRHDESAANR